MVSKILKCFIKNSPPVKKVLVKFSKMDMFRNGLFFITAIMCKKELFISKRDEKKKRDKNNILV